MTKPDLAAIKTELPADARMNAYYYGFDRTGVGLIDSILSAVAVAGKGSHHTDSWCDKNEFGYYCDWPGLPVGADSAVDLIQQTANRGAKQVADLLAYIDELEAQVERVRGLHRRVHAVFNWRSGPRYDEPCPDCDGKAGVHDCGCWAESDSEFVCAECHRLGGGSRDTSYPCPTIQALGGDNGNTGKH